MDDARALVKHHLEGLLEAAEGASISSDQVGRLLLEAVVDIWRQERSYDDIAAELTFTAENLDPDTDFAFMRP